METTPLDEESLSTELQQFRGCGFTKLHEREAIEELVQNYVDSPGVYSIRITKLLLFHLVNSEYVPFQSVVRTGLQPTGFLISAFPRAGPWIVYGAGVAIWLVSVRVALRPHASLAELAAVSVWIALLSVLSGYHAFRAWRFKRLNVDLASLMESEIRPGNFDPETLSWRLRRLEKRFGLRLHSNVFALLRLHRRLFRSRQARREGVVGT